MTWFPRDTVWDTTPWCHAALGTVGDTLAWGLFLREHPWNIVRDCLFSFVSVFSSNLRYRAPLSATWGRARWPVLGPSDRFTDILNNLTKNLKFSASFKTKMSQIFLFVHEIWIYKNLNTLIFNFRWFAEKLEGKRTSLWKCKICRNDRSGIK